MSDERGHEQPEVLSGVGTMAPGYLSDPRVPERAEVPLFGTRPPASPRIEVAPAELQLRQLTGAWEIAEVAHLRRQIQLPAAVLADPGFAALEKKETGSVSWRHSNGVTSQWAP